MHGFRCFLFPAFSAPCSVEIWFTGISSKIPTVDQSVGQSVNFCCLVQPHFSEPDFDLCWWSLLVWIYTVILLHKFHVGVTKMLFVLH
jgi:hypothetical protein